MKPVLNLVYKMRNGNSVLIDGAAKVSDRIWYWRGVTQTGKSISYDDDGKSQFIGSVKPEFDLVDRVYGQDRKDFKVFDVRSQWVTPGDRLWEVVAISRDEKYPIIANHLLPDGNFSATLKRFNWDGQPHDGSSSVLWKRVS